MSIEKLIEAHTAAVTENTEMMKKLVAAIKTAGAADAGASAPAAAPEAETTGRGRSSRSKPKDAEKPAATVTEDDVANSFKKIQEEVGKPEAKAAVKEFGYDRLADIPEDRREEAVKFAATKLKELLTKQDNDDDGDDL